MCLVLYIVLELNVRISLKTSVYWMIYPCKIKVFWLLTLNLSLHSFITWYGQKFVLKGKLLDHIIIMTPAWTAREGALLMVTRLVNRPYSVKSHAIMWNHMDFWVKHPFFGFTGLRRLMNCLKKTCFPMKLRMMICTEPVQLWHYWDHYLFVTYQSVTTWSTL